MRYVGFTILTNMTEEFLLEEFLEKEKELGEFPDNAMTYMQLDRDAKIKQQIYTSLVNQCEQDKIQEAMESMDIQVIDPADLPDEDKPAFPIKKQPKLYLFPAMQKLNRITKQR